jgi:NAD(P)-dependent dehydrogenase (short-subunit alcohol dehydrogenase family)
VLITGGCGGIGAATAGRFVRDGARVVVLDNDNEGCDRLQRELPGLLGALVADVTDLNSVQSAFHQLDELCQGVDILINNAGISLPHAFTEISSEDWCRVINVNLTGIFHVAQEAAKRMLIENQGVILNMGSTNALIGVPRYADYNASKAGVVELTRTLALELAPTIRVNAICPGFVLTPMQKAEYTSSEIQAFAKKIPLQRCAEPEEVAALFAFLASDEAAYITGQCIVIDGGETAGGLASR